MAPVGAPVGALLQISAAHTEKFQGVGQTVPRSFPHLLRDHGRSPDASHGRRRRYQRSAPSRNRTSRRFAEGARSAQADNHSARNAWADFRIGRRRGTAGRLAGLPRRDGAMVRPAPEDDDARALTRRFRLTRLAGGWSTVQGLLRFGGRSRGDATHNHERESAQVTPRRR